jgi:transcriptional regulator with XRE-family HTH domain
MLTSIQHFAMIGMEGGEPMTLGPFIKELRRQRHLTQRQLAEKIGVDFSYLSKIENDRLEHTPSLKTLQDLAKALEVDELELMELADKVPPVLKAIARDKDAMRFFRRATQTIKSSEGWRDLLAYIERQAQDQ